MLTVKKLRELLQEFPDDANCFAYEGEVIGIVIRPPIGFDRKQGFIPCDDGDSDQSEDGIEPLCRTSVTY